MYQRKYVWGLEKEWTPLWDDVRNCAEAIDRSGSSDGVQHFLGAIVLQKAETRSIMGLQPFSIIDGQQRLTTLQTLLAAMRRVSNEVSPRHAPLFQHLTTNHDPRNDPEVERYKVWPSTFDREAFTAAIDAQPRELTDDSGDAAARWRTRPRLIEAGAYFERVIREWVTEAADGPEARFDALYLAIRDSLLVVSIRLEANEDAQVIFETMNARGVPLRPSDLIRNFLFHQAVRRGENPDGLYTRYWREFDQEGIGDLAFWTHVEAVGRERQQRLVAFLLHFLENQLARELSANTMFEAFREWWQANEEKLGGVEATLRMLREHGKVYKTILRPEVKTSVGEFITRLNTLQYRTAYPLLLHLLTRFERNDARLAQIAHDLDSWMVRRYVCRLQTRNYGQTFIALLKHIKDRDLDEVPQGVREYLSRYQDDARRWPSDDEFRRAWITQPNYRRLQSSGLRVIFKALEATHTTDMQETVVYHPNLTVEHVMPVQWRRNWTAPDPMLATLDETAEEARDRLLHTFGNLTLLTQKLNSKNGNAPFSTKKRHIAKHATLRLNTYFRELEAWDEINILKRGEELFDKATGVWPYCATTPSTDVPEVPRVSLEKRHLILREKLQVLLPQDFTIREGGRYTQYRKDTWPDQLHYELGAGVYKGKLNISLDSEFTRNDPRRQAGHDLLNSLAHRIDDAFSDNDVEINHYTRASRKIDLLYDPEIDDATILADFAKLVDLTFEFVNEHVQSGPLAATLGTP